MIRVSVDLNDDLISQLKENLAGLSGGAGAKVMPGTSRAFNMAAKLIQKSWQNWAMGGSLIGAADIKNPNSRLASSIHIRKINDFDMSSRVTQSGKNKGVPYLIIPFRWGTPNKDGSARAHFGNTIPLEVYKILQSRKFRKSETTENTHPEANFKGENIERAEYDWGDRIKDEDAGNANGMVKMRSNTGSTYFTFRVISAKSPESAWVRKEVPANDVVSAVEKTTRQNVEDILEAGLEQDLGI